MMTTEVLANVRVMRLRIIELQQRLFDGDDIDPFEQAKHDEINSLRIALVNLLPRKAQEDRALVALLQKPHNGLWFDVERAAVTLDVIEGWLDEMTGAATPELKQLAELKVLFYFGSHEALLIAWQLYCKTHDARQLTTTKRQPAAIGAKPYIKMGAAIAIVALASFVFGVSVDCSGLCKSVAGLTAAPAVQGNNATTTGFAPHNE